MVIKKNTAEGGSNGTTVTTANSGSTSGDVFAQVVGAVTFATSSEQHGSLGYHFAPVSGSACRVRWTGFNDTTGVVRGYRVTDPTMTVSDGILAIGTTSTTVMALQATSGGKYYLTDSGGTTLATSTNSRAAGDRIELSWTIGTTTSNGAWDFYFYRGDSTTTVEHLSGTTANLGLSNWDRIDFGKSSSSTQAGAFDWDDMVAASGTTALFGPPAAAPTAAFTATPSGLNVAFDGTASTYNSPATSIISYAWDFGDGNSGVGSTTSHTYSGSGTHTVQLTVTDSQDNSNTVSHSVTTTGANQAPTANAGPDQSGVSPGATIMLDGSGSSDVDGTVAAYAWTQTAGTTVTLSDSTVQKPTFTAPSGSAQTLTFSLTVTDNSGAISSADTVNIGVLASNTGTIIKSNIAEGGTNGTGVTTGNSGGTSGTAWNVVATTSGTLTYDTASAVHGSLGIKFAPASGQQCMVRWTGFNDVTGVIGRYVTIDTLPASGNESIVSINTATGGGVITIAISSAGKYQILDSAGATISGSTTTNSHVAGDRLALSWSVATASTGSFNFGLYRGTSSTAIETKSGSTVNLGTTNWDRVQFGKTSTSTWTGVQHGDDFAAASGTQTFFGPNGANIAPVANAGGDQINIEPYATVTLDGSGSNDPDGTIASYAWTQTAGTTVSLSSSTAQMPTFVAPATINGGTLTFSLVVTDNSGASSTAATVNVTIDPHTMWRLDNGGPTPLQLTRL